MGQDFHGFCGPLETVGRAPHPVVFLLKAVEADGDGVEAGLEEFFNFLRGEQTAVGDHAPREFQVIDGTSAFEQVLAHQRFPTGDDDHDPVGVVVFLDADQDLVEIIKRHVGLERRSLAVTSAVAAMKVASQGGLPEELGQGMLLLCIPHQLAVQLQGNALFEGEARHLFVVLYRFGFEGGVSTVCAFIPAFSIFDFLHRNDVYRVLVMTVGGRIQVLELEVEFAEVSAGHEGSSGESEVAVFAGYCLVKGMELGGGCSILVGGFMDVARCHLDAFDGLLGLRIHHTAFYIKITVGDTVFGRCLIKFTRCCRTEAQHRQGPFAESGC